MDIFYYLFYKKKKIWQYFHLKHIVKINLNKAHHLTPKRSNGCKKSDVTLESS